MTGPADGTGDDLDELIAAIGDARAWTWVLDFDGTLSQLVDEPEAARFVEGARQALVALAEHAEVALLSGRAVDDLAQRIGAPLPHVLLIGGHGSEAIWPDGRHEPLLDLDAVEATIAEMARHLEAELDADAGWLVERKPSSLAVHYRQVDADLADRRLPMIRERLERATHTPPGFELLEGKAVVEIVPKGVSKGHAIDWLIDQSARQPPLVVGDDVTDELAFAAASRHAGVAVRVGAAGTATAARYRLASPSRVVAMLTQARKAVVVAGSPGAGKGPAWSA